MAGAVINLRQARKRKLRAERERQAEVNRFEHGRSRHEKELATRLNLKAASDLKARRLQPLPDGEPEKDPSPSGH